MADGLYQLFNRFFQSGLPGVVGSHGVALYLALVQKSNELYDPDRFTFTTTEAMMRSGITHPQTFQRARAKLVEAGLVRYDPSPVSREMGIYSELDLELDPAEVAERLTLRSQLTHTPITSCSHSDHIPITGPPPVPPGDVSIIQTIQEQPRPDGSMLPDGGTAAPQSADGANDDAEAAGVWEQVLTELHYAVPRPAEQLLRSSRAEWRGGGRHRTLLIHLPPGPPAGWRPDPLRLVLRQAVRRVTGTQVDLEFVQTATEARAGPEEG